MFDEELWGFPVYQVAAVVQFVLCMFLAGHFSRAEKFAEGEEDRRARYERQQEQDKLMAYGLMYGGLMFVLLCIALAFIASL